ncbi:hypothetical protein AYK24_08710 [Thermoplasmatales archaeon SG8-52-4]|nr:MAG: hypothetical protein AYK24_08710 [Thermoplasmatales archaeon SG8-52-4]
MSSEIHFKEHTDYLEIKYIGYNNIKEFFDSLETAFDICKKKNFTNIILDTIEVDFTNVQDMDRFYAGEKIAKVSCFPNNIKVAVVGPKKYYTGFADNVATNRGAIIKIFQNKNDAIKWIMK